MVGSLSSVRFRQVSARKQGFVPPCTLCSSLSGDCRARVRLEGGIAGSRHLTSNKRSKPSRGEALLLTHSFSGSFFHSLNWSRVARMTFGLRKRGLPTLVEPSPPHTEASLLTPQQSSLRGWRASHRPPLLLGAWPPHQTASVSLSGHHLLNVSMFQAPAGTFTRNLGKVVYYADLPGRILGSEVASWS